MTFPEANVVIVAGILNLIILSWLIVSRLQTRKALRWWYGRQHMRMCQESEAIRNQRLQELFVLRRHLELSGLNLVEDVGEKSHLNNIQKIHNSLKELSEFLCPAHIDDSLPLALNSLFKSWKMRFPELEIKFTIPVFWHKESEEKSRIVLMFVEELLQIITSNCHDLPLMVATLKSQANKNYLEIQLISNSTFDCSYLQNINLLCRIFNVFADGQCSYKQNNDQQIWYLSWKRS